MAKTKYEYKIVGCKPGKYVFPKFGEIDLRNLTDKRAQDLIDRGFPYLEKVKVSKDKDS